LPISRILYKISSYPTFLRELTTGPHLAHGLNRIYEEREKNDAVSPPPKRNPKKEEKENKKVM